jgi:hypothetical protein
MSLANILTEAVDINVIPNDKKLYVVYDTEEIKSDKKLFDELLDWLNEDCYKNYDYIAFSIYFFDIKGNNYNPVILTNGSLQMVNYSAVGMYSYNDFYNAKIFNNKNIFVNNGVNIINRGIDKE